MIRDLILLAVGGLLLLFAVRSLRAQRLKERYAILFSVIALPFLILAVWPDALGQSADWLGMPYHTLLVLLVTLFFLIINFKLLSIVSVQDRRITELSQAIGILTARHARGDAVAPSQPQPQTDADEHRPR